MTCTFMRQLYIQSGQVNVTRKRMACRLWKKFQKEFIKNNLDGKAILSILAEVLGEEEDGWKSDLSSMVEAVAKVRKNQ